MRFLEREGSGPVHDDKVLESATRFSRKLGFVNGSQRRETLRY